MLLGHTIDRCSVGCCYSHFMMYAGFAWMTTWGYCHDTWNSIRNAAKQWNHGIFWKCITKFTSVANTNHMPFKSGAWGKQKQTCHANLCKIYANGTHEHFKAAAKDIAKMLGRPEPMIGFCECASGT